MEHPLGPGTRPEVPVPHMVVVRPDHDILVCKITLPAQDPRDIVRVGLGLRDLNSCLDGSALDVLDHTTRVGPFDELVERVPVPALIQDPLRCFWGHRQHRDIKARPLLIHPRHRRGRRGRINRVENPRRGVIGNIRRNDQHRAGAPPFQSADLVGQPGVVRPPILFPDRVPLPVHRLKLQAHRDLVAQVFIRTEPHVRTRSRDNRVPRKHDRSRSGGRPRVRERGKILTRDQINTIDRELLRRRGLRRPHRHRLPVRRVRGDDLNIINRGLRQIKRRDQPCFAEFLFDKDRRVLDPIGSRHAPLPRRISEVLDEPGVLSNQHFINRRQIRIACEPVQVPAIVLEFLCRPLLAQLPRRVRTMSDRPSRRLERGCD